MITYSGKANLFAGFALGGLVELPVGYEEERRAVIIARFIASLLGCYDVVIRVDADEFLVVDPSVASTLATYVETMAEPYLTARGFDVIQGADEPALDAQAALPLLRDRAFAYPNTALNKTCLVALPLQWSAGFHWANVFPVFGPVFLLHTKRVDLGWQMSCLQQMSSDLDNNPQIEAAVREYYAPDEAKLVAYQEAVRARPRLSGVEAWYRDRLLSAFSADIRLNPANGFYSGRYGHEDVLCEILGEWRRMI